MVTNSEQLFPGPMAVEKVTGKRPHYSTFYRWTQRGIRTSNGRRIRLEFLKAGSNRLTSVEAVRRFFQAQTEAAMQCEPNKLPSTHDTDQHEWLVEAQLREARL